MGRKCDLTQAEKDQCRILLSRGIDSLKISKKLGRDHRTIQRYVNEGVSGRKKYQKPGIRAVTPRQMRSLKLVIARKPFLSSAEIFESAGISGIPKSTRNDILRKLGNVKKQEAKSPLTRLHRQKRKDWALQYLKTDFKQVLFTDEARATLDGPDGWASGWVLKQQKTPTRYRRQQGGGGLMIWAGIINDEVVGPIQVPDGVKLDSESYCELLEEGFFTWLDKQSSARKRKLIFQQDNAPSHASRFTKAYLKERGIKEDQIMTWPPNSADLNPIENYWAILKREIYKERRQFSSKNALWEAVQQAAKSIPSSVIKKLTASMDSRLLEVTRKDGGAIKK